MIRAGQFADPQIFGDDIVVVNESKTKVGFKRFLQSIPILNTFVLY